jgi:branched-chain amino acid transport system ATP-binding protein/branched-chain amino acid transport system permease protein
MSALQLRILIAAVVLLLAAAPLFLNPFTVTLLNYIGIYGLVALGLVLLTGVGGMMSFGQAAFVGIAAYATAWVTALQGLSPWLGLVLALVLTGAVATGLGALTLRLGGHFLALSTVAWGLSTYFLLANIDGLGNFNGIGGIPPISLGSVALTASWQIFYLIWAIFLGAFVLSYNLLQSRSGRAIRALRGGNQLVESLGISAFRTRLATFVISALFAALSGWLYAHLSRFVSPAPFDVHVGIDYLMMAMVGGTTELLGAVVGAALVTLSKNSIQDYLPLIAKGASGQLEIVVFSVIFIVFLQRARNGLVPFVTERLPKLRRNIPADAPPLPLRAQPHPGTPLLKVEGAERRFGGLVAVDKVSFELRSGEILGLIGPNGAGKSTMFNLLTGILRCNRGSIVFLGKDITRAPQRDIARAGIARTFQHVKLRPKMSLLDNVLLGLHPRMRSGFISGALRLDRAEEAQARHEAMRQLQRVDLASNPFELAGNLPLGKQRVLEIARALAADPVLLVLDEPAAGLRRQEKQALAQLLKSLRSEHLTILLVEHDMEFVMGLVDRIVVMNFGCKLCEGAPAAIRGDQRVQDAYLGGVA